MGRGIHMKDTVMDVVISSALTKSCLHQQASSSDFVNHRAEKVKFNKDLNSNAHVQTSATRRLIPLAMNHFGLRGGHFSAALREFASILVNNPSGCKLMMGPFALNMTSAFHKILNHWGFVLTWTAQREHAAQIVRGMESFYSSHAYLSSTGQRLTNMGVGSMHGGDGG